MVLITLIILIKTSFPKKSMFEDSLAFL